MSVNLKIRIASGPQTAMGPGKALLLEAINSHGSISKAAKSMRMSYRRAWELVNEMNQCFIKPLVHTTQGGVHGGGAQVSDLGQLVLQSYRIIETKAANAVEVELGVIYSNLSEQPKATTIS